MTGYPCPDTEVSVYWSRKGVFVIFPISPGRYRVIADLPPTGASHPPTPTLEEVQAIINEHGPERLVASDPIWLAGFRINGRKVSSYRWGRIFLAGDAAHVHSPAGGQGMNTGMQDAFNLAWKLTLVVRGTCSEHLLDSYSPERSHVGDEVVKGADRLTEIGTLRNPILQVVRNLVGQVMLGIRPVQHALMDTMTEVSISYPRSPLNGPSLGGAGPKPGEQRRTHRQPRTRGIGHHATLCAFRGQDHRNGRSRKIVPRVARSRHSAAFPRWWKLVGSTRRLRRVLVQRRRRYCPLSRRSRSTEHQIAA